VRRLSCGDWAFPRLPHAAALATIAALEIPAVDAFVCAGSDHTDLEAVRADPAAAAAGLRRRLDAAGLELADVFAVFAEFGEEPLNHPDPEARRRSFESFLAVLHFADRAGAPGVTLLPGVVWPELGAEASLELAASELQRRAAAGAERGLRVSVEPHVESVAEAPERALALLAAAPDLTLTLDPSHLVYRGYGPEQIAPLFARSGHVHLRPAAAGAMQLPVAESGYDLGAFLAALAASGYEGTVACDFLSDPWYGCNRVDCVSEIAELRDLVVGARE
jgi:sugar phosphate isomerase/epimerase